jgi:hypothetical protein
VLEQQDPVLPQVKVDKEEIQFLMHAEQDVLLHIHLPEADMAEDPEMPEPTEDRAVAEEKVKPEDQEIHLLYHLLKEIQVEVFHQAE